MPAILFWASLVLIVYHHLGYPLLVQIFLALGLGRKSPSADVHAKMPSITLIVPAYNEAAVIAAKIRNLAELDYSAAELICVVALDGCTDDTEAVAAKAIAHIGGGAIRLVDYNPNIGKVAVLNDQIARARTDVVALTDASASVAADALVKAAAHFKDPAVGVVTGSYSVAGLGDGGESAYWRYQTLVRSGESRLAGPMGAHGAFYLFRRSAWSPLPPDTINDDFVLPMRIVLGGLRSVYEPAITARELERSTPRQEFRRRIRIGAGNLQQVWNLMRLGDPRRGWLAFAFLSGKGLRGILPLLLVTLVVTTAWQALEGRRGFQVLFIAQAMAVSLAWWGGSVRWLRRSRYGSALVYALEGYLATTMGALIVLARQEHKVWRMSKATDRSAT